MGFLDRNTRVSFQQFIKKIKNGNDNLLQILGIKETYFTDAPYHVILDNPGDIAEGVNRVQVLLQKSHFSLFDTLLIKHHDNGEVRYMFYTTTHNPFKVLDIADVLAEESEKSTYDDSRFHAFFERDIVLQMAKSPIGTVNKDIVQVYHINDYLCVLDYKAQPHGQLVLSISKKVPKPIDYSVKRKGTVLDLLNIDIASLLSTPEIKRETDFTGILIKFVDYTYTLKYPEMGIFDRATIRVFSSEKQYHPSIQTHLTLSASQKPSLAKISEVTNKLIKMYGSDRIGSEELTLTDLDTIERDTFWVGRNWNLNAVHAQTKNTTEPSIYHLGLGYDDSKGFNLSILSYNRLEEYFGVK